MQSGDARDRDVFRVKVDAGIGALRKCKPPVSVEAAPDGEYLCR
jgi:hypothetical protein